MQRLLTACFLFALPQFAIPSVGTYRPPAASALLVLVFAIALLRPAGLRITRADPGNLRKLLIGFLVYCSFSAVYGYWTLYSDGHEVLRLTTGDVEYWRVVSERLFQIILMISAFEMMYACRIPPSRLMQWWLLGLAFSSILHAMTYVITDDPMAHRAGTFNEGNQAGLYYLISFYIALEYRRTESRRAGTIFVAFSIIGLLLSKSSAGILLLLFTFTIKFIINRRTPLTRFCTAALTFIIVPIIAIIMFNAKLDFGIGEKLFGQEVTATSFSRIDRIESISAALQLFSQSPLLGNGLQSYSFLSNDLIQGPLLELYDFSYRRIPNNIYAEIAAELGIFGICLTGAFMISFLYQIRRSKQDWDGNFQSGVWSTLLYWLAFPTYSVIFVWAFFGLTLSVLRARRLKGTVAQKNAGAIT